MPKPRRRLNIALITERGRLVNDKARAETRQRASEAVERGEWTDCDATGVKELAGHVKLRGRTRPAGEDRKTGTR